MGALSITVTRSMVPDPLVVEAAPLPATQPVVVAARDLGFGATLDKASLRVVDWPATSVPPGSFASLADLIPPGAEPRVALRTIAPGEPVLEGRVSGAGGRASLSTQIASGMRALTIPVNVVKGVAGFVLPGDRVDVMLTRPGASDLPTTARARSCRADPTSA